MNFEHQAVIPEFIITLRHLLRTEAADWKNPLYTVMPRFSIHRFSRNPDLVENFAATNHFYSIKLQYSRNFNLVD